ncbi:hypothetical protein LMG8286_01503 [Campylobacter suis]|uniref:Uncharacterized protein n=2 Tax=Campylobacter suis TaxID=2790657 RepID=A0ABN7K8B9_9BACT|nr:hypothetical protein LMG8286_01503 [Campylobacter suis]
MHKSFYMDSADEREFFDFISEIGGEFLFMKNLQIFSSQSAYAFDQVARYIYSKKFGELKIYNETQIKNEHIGAFSQIDSPVITYTQTQIINSEKLVKAGKISVKMSYMQDGKMVKKSNELEKFYNKLTLWIETHVSKKPIFMGFYEARVNMSKSISTMFEDGALHKFN